MFVCFKTLSGLAQVSNGEGLTDFTSMCFMFYYFISLTTTCPHLPNHHVLGSSYHSADPILTVFSHQAVGMQVDIFSICDQLNNNLCRSHIVANLYEKHILNS